MNVPGNQSTYATLERPVPRAAVASAVSKWEVHTDEYGSMYFYNTITGESVWELPPEEEEDDPGSKSTENAGHRKESHADREPTSLAAEEYGTSPVKLKAEYSMLEIAIEVIDTMVVMLDKVGEGVQEDASSNDPAAMKKKKKKRFASPAAEARFKKNLANEDKKKKRMREKSMVSYMQILIPPSTCSTSDNSSDHKGSEHLPLSQNSGLQNVGALFTLEDTLRWRLEREVQQIKQRHAIRQERHRHQKQVLCLKMQQQMLKDFRTELTRHLLSQIECSAELRQQRILLLSTPRQLAEMDAKRMKTMEPEIAERYANEQHAARVDNVKNIQKVFVLIDEAGSGKLHLLQILFGIFTLERSQTYALKVRGLAALLNTPEIQKFLIEFVSNSHLKDCVVTMDELVEFVSIVEEVLDHYTSVKTAVKEAEDEIEATFEAAAAKPGMSLIRARIGIVSKKKVEQEIAALKATEEQIRARQERERREAFQSDDVSLLAPKETWEKNHHHRFIRFDEKLPLYCCLCRRRKWEVERREHEERESQYRTQWSALLALKEEELKLVEKDPPDDTVSASTEDNVVNCTSEEAKAEIVAEAAVSLPGSLDAPQTRDAELDLAVFEVVRSLVTLTERMMSTDPSDDSESSKRRVHKKSARFLHSASPKHKKKKEKRSKKGGREADAALQQAMTVFENEENARRCLHTEEVQMMLFLERSRRSVERPLLQVQDSAHNAYIRMLTHIVNPTPFLYRLQFLRCLAFDPPQRLVLQMHDYAENTASDGTCVNYAILQTVPCRNESEGNQIFKQIKMIEEKLRSPFVAQVVSASKHTFQFFADSGMLVECWPIVFVATEYFPAGSWLRFFQERFVQKQHENAATAYAHMEQHLLSIFREVAAGLSAMHSLGILHLNVNLENIYVSHFESKDAPHVKLSGFLASKVAFAEEQLKTGTMQQCIDYSIAPPEVIKDHKQVTTKADVWMLGCALYEALLLWQRQQLQTHSSSQSGARTEGEKSIVHLKCIQEIVQEIPISTSTTVRSLLRMLLQPNPAQRPHMSQVIDYLSFAGKQNLMSYG